LFLELRKKDDFRKNREKALIKQRILHGMQNRTEQDVLKAYKNTDRITRNQMWIRFSVFRKAFNEIDDSEENNLHGPGVISRTEWYKKETG
jgi:hypothetical protein